MCFQQLKQATGAVAQLGECLCIMYKALSSILSFYSLGVEVETGGSEVQDFVLLYGEFKALWPTQDFV